MSYSNPQVDKLMDESSHELDPKKRIAELQEINNIVNDELPIGCLLFRKGRVGYAKRVHNFYAERLCRLARPPQLHLDRVAPRRRGGSGRWAAPAPSSHGVASFAKAEHLMTGYVLRRIALMIPILFGVSIVTFAITASTGSPLNQLEFNPRIRPEDIARIQHNLGLDKPILERYFIWLSHVIRGDFGLSLANYTPVTNRILQVMPNTLLLSGLSIFLSFALALPIGIYAAVHRNSILDRLATTAAVAGFAIPTVWLGLMLIILFAVKFQDWGLPTLPVGGVRDLRSNGGIHDRIIHLILPTLALVIPQMAGWIVYVRSTMLEVIRSGLHPHRALKGTYGSRGSLQSWISQRLIAVDNSDWSEHSRCLRRFAYCRECLRLSGDGPADGGFSLCQGLHHGDGHHHAFFGARDSWQSDRRRSLCRA